MCRTNILPAARRERNRNRRSPPFRATTQARHRLPVRPKRVRRADPCRRITNRHFWFIAIVLINVSYEILRVRLEWQKIVNCRAKQTCHAPRKRNISMTRKMRFLDCARNDRFFMFIVQCSNYSCLIRFFALLGMTKDDFGTKKRPSAKIVFFVSI